VDKSKRLFFAATSVAVQLKVALNKAIKEELVNCKKAERMRMRMPGKQGEGSNNSLPRRRKNFASHEGILGIFFWGVGGRWQRWRRDNKNNFRETLKKKAF